MPGIHPSGVSSKGMKYFHKIWGTFPIFSFSLILDVVHIFWYEIFQPEGVSIVYTSILIFGKIWDSPIPYRSSNSHFLVLTCLDYLDSLESLMNTICLQSSYWLKTPFVSESQNEFYHSLPTHTYCRGQIFVSITNIKGSVTSDDCTIESGTHPTSIALKSSERNLILGRCMVSNKIIIKS